MPNDTLNSLIGTKIGELTKTTVNKANKIRNSLKSKFISSIVDDEEDKQSSSKNDDGSSKSSIKDLLTSINKNVSTVASIVGTISSNLSGRAENASRSDQTGASFSAESENKVDIPQEQLSGESENSESGVKKQIQNSQNEERGSTPSKSTQNSDDGGQNQSGPDERGRSLFSRIFDPFGFSKIGAKIVSSIEGLGKYLSGIVKPQTEAKMVGNSTNTDGVDRKTSLQVQGPQESSGSIKSIEGKNNTDNEKPSTEKTKNDSQKSSIFGSVLSNYRKIFDPFGGLRNKMVDGIKSRLFGKSENDDVSQTAPIGQAIDTKPVEESGNTNNVPGISAKTEGADNKPGMFGSILSAHQKVFDPFGLGEKFRNKIKNVFTNEEKGGIGSVFQKHPMFAAISKIKDLLGGLKSSKIEPESQNNEDTTGSGSQVEETDVQNVEQPAPALSQSSDETQTSVPASGNGNITLPDGRIAIPTSENGMFAVKGAHGDTELVDKSGKPVDEMDFDPDDLEKVRGIAELELHEQNIENPIQQDADKAVPVSMESIQEDQKNDEIESTGNKQVEIDADSVKIVQNTQGASLNEEIGVEGNEPAKIAPTIEQPETNAGGPTAMTNESTDNGSGFLSKIMGLINPSSKSTDEKPNLLGKISGFLNPLSKGSDDKSSIFDKIGGIFNPFSSVAEGKPSLLGKIGDFINPFSKNDNAVQQISDSSTEDISAISQNSSNENTDIISSDVQQGPSSISEIGQDGESASSTDEMVSGMNEACAKLGSIEEILSKLVEGISKPVEPLSDLTEDESSFDGSSVI